MELKLTTLVVIGTDYIHVGGCKSNYHTIPNKTPHPQDVSHIIIK